MGDETVEQDGETVPADDALAPRLRSSIEGDAAPVSLDEVRRRADEATSQDGVSGETALDAETNEGEVATRVAADESEPSTASSGPDRPRVLLWLAAAAAIVLLAGIGALVATRPTGDAGDDLDVTSGPGTTTLATTPPTSTVVVEPAPGGLYDPASTILADRQVVAMARDDVGRISVSYSISTSAPDGTVVSQSGLLIADAADGSVIADHSLTAPALELAAAGPTLFLVTVGGAFEQDLWRSVDGGAPELVDRLPASDLLPAIAASGDGVWLRQAGRLQRRDPVTGELIEDSTDPAFQSVGNIAVEGSRGWTVATGEEAGLPVNVLVPFDGVAPGAVVGSESVTALAMVGDTVIVGTGRAERRQLVVNPPDGSARAVVASPHTISAIDGFDGQVWAVTNDLASSVEIGVVTFALGGEPRWLDLGFDGVLPKVVAVDEHHALVCALAVDGADASLASAGSACRLLDARTTPDAAPTTAPPETSSTTVTGAPATVPATTTTAPPPLVPEVVVTTTTIVARPLNPAGVSGSGLDPIDFHMDQSQMLAATTEPFRRANPACGHEVYLDASGGVEVHLFPIVESDGSSGARFIVGGILVKTPAYTTATGARVGMTTAQLEATVPGLAHESWPATAGGPANPGQYAQRMGQGAVLFSHADGVVTQILATPFPNTFLHDFC